MKWIKEFKEDNPYTYVSSIFKESYISLPGVLILCALVLLAMFNIGWVMECGNSDDVYTPCEDEERLFNVPLEKNNTLTATFKMIGNNMPRLWIRFTDMNDNPGKVHFKFTDFRGNVITEKNRKLKPNSETHSMTMKYTFYEDETLINGETYTVTMTYLPSDKDSKASIACFKPGIYETLFNQEGDVYSPLKDEKGKLVDTYPAFTFEYDKYPVPWFVLVIGVLLFFILLLNLFDWRIRIPVIVYGIIYAAIVPFIVFFIVEKINGSYLLLLHDPKLLVANLLPPLIVYCLLLLLTSAPMVSALFTQILFFVFAVANHYVLMFRDRPLLPWDLLAANTAAEVADSYEYPGNCYIFLGIITLIFFYSVAIHIRNKEATGDSIATRLNLTLRGMALVGFALSFFVFTHNYLPDVTADLWNIRSNYKLMGASASFAKYWSVSKYEAPEGYNKKDCEELLDAQKTYPALSDTKAVNIIYVMNETFADMRVLGENKLPKDSYMSFLDTLKENTIRGNLYIPVFGGGTANSEFEALTGITTAYIPGIPYQTFIRHDTASIATYMRHKGYLPLTYHPNKAANYNRYSVYPRLGFEKFFSLEDMEENEQGLLRGFVSDSADYKFVMKLEDQIDGSFFMFNVTMQNHSGYEHPEFEGEDLSSIGHFPKAEEYLKLITLSDEAIKELIEHYKNVEEPTLICMFGDHQGKIEDGFYEYLLGKSLGELSAEENQKRFVTPFYIWANYDIPEETIDKMSSNYLAPLVMRAAGYETNGFFSFLESLKEKYPVLSPSGIWDANGTFYGAYDISDPDIEDYKKLSYYLLHQ